MTRIPPSSLAWALLALAAPLVAQSRPEITNRNLEQYSPSPTGVVNGPVSPGLMPGLAGPPLMLPADRGAHSTAVRERWSLKGILRDASGRRIPFQVTFQSRRMAGAPQPEAWSRTAILTAQAALLPGGGEAVLTGSRMARLGLPAGTAEGRVSLKCDGWSLTDPGDGRLHLDLPLKGAHLSLSLAYRGEPLSLPAIDAADPLRRTLRPKLEIQGKLEQTGRSAWNLTGFAALLQEWGPEVPQEAPGWEQVLAFLDDGRTQLYLGFQPAAKGSKARSLLLHLDAKGIPTRVEHPPALGSLRTWTSIATRARYAISVQIQDPLQPLTFEPLSVDQEWRGDWLGALTLWSGAGRIKDPRGVNLGHAFLELAGPAHPVQGRY